MTRSGHTMRALTALAALFVGLGVLIPVIWMFAASLKPESAIHRDVGAVRGFVPAPPTLENYRGAFHRGDVGITLVNTLLVVTVITLGGLLVNGPAAFAFARMRFRGSELLFLLIVTTIIIPLELIVIPLFMTVRATRGLVEIIGERPWTLAALSIPFMAKAFNVFLLRQYFLALPRSLEEAAFMDGVGWWGVYWRVALPNAKTAITTVILLDFIVHWNDFLWPLVICQGANTRTVQLGLGNFFTQPPISWGAIMAYAVLATIPMMLILGVGQKRIAQSLVTTGIRE